MAISFRSLRVCLCLLSALAGCTSEPSSTDALTMNDAVARSPRRQLSPPVWVDVPGICNPTTFAASEVVRADEKFVIGVVVGGHARAYLLEALTVTPEESNIQSRDDFVRMLGNHIVNDLLGGLPISVTYCDITSCKAVFTAPGLAPLDLAEGGWSGDAMVLRYKGVLFTQDDAAPPVGRYPYKTMTWRAWKDSFPHTDLYLGRFANRYAEPSTDREPMAKRDSA